MSHLDQLIADSLGIPLYHVRHANGRTEWLSWKPTGIAEIIETVYPAEPYSVPKDHGIGELCRKH